MPPSHRLSAVLTLAHNAIACQTEIVDSIPIDLNSGPRAVLEMIYRLKVRDAMTPNPVTANEDWSLREIRNLMREKSLSAIPIVDNSRLIGIITIENILEALDAGKIEETARDFMTKSLIVLEAEMPLSFAINYLNRYRYRIFPVLGKDGTLCGVISASDIIRALLVEMNHEVERLEEGLAKAEPKPEESSSEVKSISISTRRWDFENAGKASAALKAELKERAVDPSVMRRASVASYELELNQVIHSEGGVMEFQVSNDKTIIKAKDTGPGIADLATALTEGYSTANDWIRSLGFGAGLGLPNARRSSDEFSIDSAPGRGTTVHLVIKHKSDEGNASTKPE